MQENSTQGLFTQQHTSPLTLPATIAGSRIEGVPKVGVSDDKVSANILFCCYSLYTVSLPIISIRPRIKTTQASMNG